MIRKASVADAASIAELGAHVFSVTFGHSLPAQDLQVYLDESYTVSALAKDIDDPAKDVIVATTPEDEIAGFAYLRRGSSEPCIADLEDKVELQRIYVHPKAHGIGIGKSLARRVESMAREQGFKYIWLGVWEENTKAMKTYEGWGYRRVGDHDFVMGSVVQTDYIMVKKL